MVILIHVCTCIYKDMQIPYPHPLIKKLKSEYIDMQKIRIKLAAGVHVNIVLKALFFPRTISTMSFS